ncbi:hypothetical protein BC834DRAFT_843469 [Gloeopeniophorella convolvens]|nr:hypothetical protein BC834DRAFT_843469 [Gloeopeniophorella convolvens]
MSSQKTNVKSVPQQDPVWDAAFKPVGQMVPTSVDPRAIERISGMPGGQKSCATQPPNNPQPTNGSATAVQGNATDPGSASKRNTAASRQQQQQPGKIQFMDIMTTGSHASSGSHRSSSNGGGSNGHNADSKQQYAKPGKPGKAASIPGSDWFPANVIRHRK